MRPRAVCLTGLLILLVVSAASAGGPCSGVKGGCGRSSYRSEPYSGSYAPPSVVLRPPYKPTETHCVHVRAYTRKDGTHVDAHTRGCHGGGGDDESMVESRVRDTYRVGARTTARTTHWSGTGSSYDDAEDIRTLSRPTPDPPEPQVKLEVKFVIIFVSGRRLEIHGYRDDAESYWVDNLNGGHTRYPKKLITKIEPVQSQPVSSPAIAQSQAATQSTIHQAASPPEFATVINVVDGDTIQIDNGDKVRLLGIAMPETVHPQKPVEEFGREASAFAKQQLQWERIKLVYDPVNTSLQHRDKYQRLLAYVYRARDGYDFNAAAIREGYAHAYTKYQFARMDEFVTLERQARVNHRGLWGAKP